MIIAQKNEIATVENAQKVQFNEFSKAWDEYMADYENAAYESIERMKEKHLKEIEEFRQNFNLQFKVKSKCSKELLEYKKQEKIFFSIKDYDKAEHFRNLANAKEKEEREEMEMQLL